MSFIGFKSSFLADTVLKLLQPSTLDGQSNVLRELPAHRVILAQQSAWFYAKLSRWTAVESTDTSSCTCSGGVPTLDVTVQLEDLDAFEAMLQQFYLPLTPGSPPDKAPLLNSQEPGSNCTLSSPAVTNMNQTVLLDRMGPDELLRVIRLSDYYSAPQPAQQAAKRLASLSASTLSWDTVGAFFTLGQHIVAQTYMQPVLLKVQQKLSNAFGDLDEAWQDSSRRLVWYSLPAAAIQAVLEDPATKVVCEDTVLLLLSEWVRAQAEEPYSTQLADLCSTVRWPLLSGAYLAGVAQTLPWFWQQMVTQTPAWMFSVKSPKPAKNEDSMPTAHKPRKVANAYARPNSALSEIHLKLELPDAIITGAFLQLQEGVVEEVLLDQSERVHWAGFYWMLEACARPDGIYCHLGVSVHKTVADGADPTFAERDVPVIPTSLLSIGLDTNLMDYTGYGIPLGSRWGTKVVAADEWSQFAVEQKIKLKACIAGPMS